MEETAPAAAVPASKTEGTEPPVDVVSDAETPVVEAASAAQPDDFPLIAKGGDSPSAEELSKNTPVGSSDADAGMEKPLNIIAPAETSPVASNGEAQSDELSRPLSLTLPLDDLADGSAVNGHVIAPAATPDAKSLVDGVVATPEGALTVAYDMASPTVAPATAAFTEDELPSSSAETAVGAPSESSQGDIAAPEGESVAAPVATGDGESDDEQEHAVIKEVVESSDAKPPPHTDEKVEQILARIRDRLPCESAEMLESGEVMVLPKGWTTRQSKTNDGKTYYVNPYGHTQWLRPPMKTGVTYHWVHEIEVTFGPGRLGLNLKQIAGLPGTEFTDLPVHIAEIYKLPNGMASPAEIYNWGVKPEKRLQVGMRMTVLGGITLTGYTYSEILELLSRVPRPVSIKFADATKGIVGRVKEEPPEEETQEEIEARAARKMQSNLQLEYFQILVAHELHHEVWEVSKKRMHRTEMELGRKCEMLATAIEDLHTYHHGLEKEREDLIQEAEKLRETLEQLKQQEAGEIESPEVAKSAELVARNAALDSEITEIIGENEELQKERVAIEESLDVVQKELDEYADFDIESGVYEIKFFSPAFLGSMVQRGSIDTRAENARERLLDKIKQQQAHYKEELAMEEERSKFVESEISQIRKQMAVAAAASRREDDMISGHRPPQLVFLENKIGMFRKNLSETVEGIGRAHKFGDTQQAENLLLRRASLKDDLKNALDELQRMENELNLFSSIDRGVTEFGPSILDLDCGEETVDIDVAPYDRPSESARLQSKLARLQTLLHDTVSQLAKASADKNDSLAQDMRTRRLKLKDEMKVVQDEFQDLTSQTLNVSARVGDSYVRPSISGPVGLPDVRPSFGGRLSEHFDLPLFNRSSSSASMASVPQSVESYQPTVVKDGSVPTMSGMLLKHPTHSNEKGMFGNMSLRGVRERWCVIDPSGCLRYYKRKGDREARGAIPLNIPSLEIVHGKEVGKASEFMICSATHQTRLGAKNREDMQRWVAALEQAHSIFMQQAPIRGSTDSRAPGQADSVRSTDSAHNAPSPASQELAVREQRATLGF